MSSAVAATADGLAQQNNNESLASRRSLVEVTNTAAASDTLGAALRDQDVKAAPKTRNTFVTTGKYIDNQLPLLDVFPYGFAKAENPTLAIGESSDDSDVDCLTPRDLFDRLTLNDPKPVTTLRGSGLTPTPEFDRNACSYHYATGKDVPTMCYNSMFATRMSPPPLPTRTSFNGEEVAGSPINGLVKCGNDRSSGRYAAFSTPVDIAVPHGCFVDKSPDVVGVMPNDNATDKLERTPEVPILQSTGLTPTPEPKGLPPKYGKFDSNLPLDVNIYTNSMFGSVMTPSPVSAKQALAQANGFDVSN